MKFILVLTKNSYGNNRCQSEGKSRSISKSTHSFDLQTDFSILNYSRVRFPQPSVEIQSTFFCLKVYHIIRFLAITYHFFAAFPKSRHDFKALVLGLFENISFYFSTQHVSSIYPKCMQRFTTFLTGAYIFLVQNHQLFGYRFATKKLYILLTAQDISAQCHLFFFYSTRQQSIVSDSHKSFGEHMH